MFEGKSNKIEVPLVELDEAYASLLRACLRHAREIGDDDRFGSIVARLQNLDSPPSDGAMTNAQSYLRHEQILQALGRLQQSKCRDLLQSWDANAADPIWSARRAALCLECGVTPLGVDLLEKNLERLRSSPLSSDIDIRRMSLEGIVLNLLRVVRQAEQFSLLGAAPQSQSTLRMESQGSEKASDAQQTDESSAIPKNLGPPSGQTPVKSVDKSNIDAKRDQKRILDRLSELRLDGCDPNEFEDWLKQATVPEPRITHGSVESEGFDIGRVYRGGSFGTERQLKAAYLALRFIEDAALPLEIQAANTIMAKTLFRQAVRTVAVFAPHEAVGMFMRAKDSKLTQEVLSRDCLARLSTAQIESLLKTAHLAIRDALSHLGLRPTTRDPDDEFWTEQLQIGCVVLGRTAVCLNDKQIRDVLAAVANLPQDKRLHGRWSTQDSLSDCIRRAAKSLNKKNLEEHLPLLLETPVRGSVELPVTAVMPNDWYDPVSMVARFRWQSTSPQALQIREKINSIVSTIATARGEERVNLCLRATHLLEVGLFSETQRKQFRDALFAHSDAHGLPVETGCLDTLILLLPPREGFNEVAAFRAKYLTPRSQTLSWQSLRQTLRSDRRLRYSATRRVNWTRRDLSAILKLADSWLAAATPPAKEQPKRAHPFGGMFEASQEQNQAEFLEWLGTLENLIFLNPKASDRQRVIANELVEKAIQKGWSAIHATASRVLWNFIKANEAVSVIRTALGDRDPMTVRQACDAIVWWQELEQIRELAFPNELLQILAALMVERRHDHLPLLISTCEDIIERSGPATRSSFFKDIWLIAINLQHLALTRS